MNKIYTLSLLSILTVVTGFVFINNAPSEASYIPRSENSPQQRNSWDGAVEIQRYLHGDDYNAVDVINTLENAERIASRRSSSLGVSWSNIGPENIGGRTRVFLQSKLTEDKLFAGSASGGLFVSDNGGNTWRPINDLAPNNIISSGDVASDGTIYIGTGCQFDGFASSLFTPWPGKGIFKSTDDGETFQVLESTIPRDGNGDIDSSSNTLAWTAVNELLVDPNDDNTIYAATNRGLQVSNDGGQTWRNPLFLDCALSIQFADATYDLTFTADNQRLLVATRGGFFYSDNPASDDCFERVESSELSPGVRTEIKGAPSNPNVVYALVSVSGTSGFGAVFGNVYRSNDKGETWDVMDPAPPTNSINWQFCGGNGQCVYNLTLGVYPDNEDHILIGGVQLWRYDGNWTRVANENFDPFSTNGGEFYVHADKHNFQWDDDNPNKIYITTDGGVHITEDRATTFNTSNRNYVTTQYYGIHFSKEGAVIGGTQDNGVLLMNVDELGSPTTANRVINQGILNGDGFECEVSQIVDLKFTTAQSGNLGRGQIESFTGAGICGGLCGNGPFWTSIRLWESANDLSSKDSIEFRADTLNQAIGVGSATARIFRGTLEPIQESAEIVYSSLSFSAGQAVIHDFDGDGVFQTADGEATVDPATGTFEVTFNNPPNLNLAVFANYGTRYSAGAEIEIASVTDNIPINYTFTQDLNPGEAIMIQDPVQSLMAFPAGSGIQIARGIINLNRTPEWINVSQNLPGGEVGAPVVGGGQPLEFTKDGNHLFVGANSGVYRISNLNELYEETDKTKLTSRQIFGASGGNVTGIAIHPEDPEKIVVTVGGYNVSQHVFVIENAISATGTGDAISRAVMGTGGSAPLPALPVYDAEFDEFNPSTVVIGTLYGVWATRDIFANPVEWSNETGSLARVPVYDIRQQKLPWNEAVNSGVMYAGTHGRGIWSTDAFVSVPEYDDIDFGSDFEANLKVYPNPMQTNGFIQFDLPKSTEGQLMVYNISGQEVFNRASTYPAGQNIINFNASELSNGTYIAVLRAGNKSFTNKFVKR